MQFKLGKIEIYKHKLIKIDYNQFEMTCVDILNEKKFHLFKQFMNKI